MGLNFEANDSVPVFRAGNFVKFDRDVKVVVQVVVIIYLESYRDAFVVLDDLGMLFRVFTDDCGAGQTIGVQAVLKILVNQHLVVIIIGLLNGFKTQLYHASASEAHFVNYRSSVIIFISQVCDLTRHEELI